MKTIKVVVTQILRVPDKWTIEKEPGGEFKCLKVGKKFYDAGIMWLEHVGGMPPGVETGDDADAGYWVEDRSFTEDAYDRMASEDAKFAEVKARG